MSALEHDDDDPAAPDRHGPPTVGPTGPSPGGPRVPPAQPRGRGVAARRHAAVAGRHRRRHRGRHQRRRLLQAGPRPRLRRHLRPLQPGRARRPVTVAEVLRRADLLDAIGGAGAARHPAGRHAGHHLGRPLRPHRRGARPPAPAHLRRRRDRRDRLRHPRRRRRRRSTGPSRWSTRSPSAGSPTRWRRSAACSTPTSTASRRSTSGARSITGAPHRLHRPRRDPRRPAAFEPRSSSAPGPRWAKPAFALGHCHARGSRSPQAGARVQPRDEPARGQPAHPVRRGEGRLEPGPHRQAHRGRLGQDQPTPSAASPTPRSTSTTTPTSRSWTSGPRPAGYAASSASSASSSSTTSSS